MNNFLYGGSNNTQQPLRRDRFARSIYNRPNINNRSQSGSQSGSILSRADHNRYRRELYNGLYNSSRSSSPDNSMNNNWNSSWNRPQNIEYNIGGLEPSRNRPQCDIQNSPYPENNRTPSCIPQNNCLNQPVAILDQGVPSGAWEYRGVGTILPKFSFTERYDPKFY